MAIIFVLDIDGVLVTPGGYRTALKRTISHFLSCAGLPEDFNLTEDEIGTFEANSITSEWDLVPLTFAMIFDQALENKDLTFHSLEQACEWMRNSTPPLTRPAYTAQISKWLEMRIPQLPVADSLFVRIRDKLPSHPFPNLIKQPFAREILANTRDFSANPMSRVFQNHVLGKKLFTQYYPGLPALNVESTLEKYDTPNIPSKLQAEISLLIKIGKLRASAMTLRPNYLNGISLNGSQYRAGFSPEAEIALQMCGLDGIPLVGYGSLLWAGEEYHLSIDEIIKPSAFHGLAAIIAGFTNLSRALRLSHYLYRKEGYSPSAQDFRDELNQCLPEEPLHLHLFEDSPNGIKAIKDAAQILQKEGWQVTTHLWGITSHPQKKEALEKLGALVLPATGQALQIALESAGFHRTI